MTKVTREDIEMYVEGFESGVLTTLEAMKTFVGTTLDLGKFKEELTERLKDELGVE